MQIAARDRTRIGLQAEVVGANALGVRNLLCLSGDHQSKGDHPGAKNVHDIDSIQLVAMVRAMRDESRYMDGREIKTPPMYFLGAAAGHQRPTDDREVDLLADDRQAPLRPVEFLEEELGLVF